MTNDKKKRSKFEELVIDVAANSLEPAENLTAHEVVIDEYIKTHSLCYVLEGKGNYWIRYEHDGHWFPLSWFKLRRDCPIVFSDARSYLVGQALVMSRLKKAHRVFKKAVYVDVRFE